MADIRWFLNNGNYYYVGFNIPEHISGVSLDASLIPFNYAGETYQLTATIEPSGAVDEVNYSWSSSDTSIATVTPNGLVTCVTPGECTITVTVNGEYTAICQVSKLVVINQTFSYTGADQERTVPATEEYIITAKGAGSNTSAGGLGQGTLLLTAGSVLKIMVGQRGNSQSSVTYGFGGSSNYGSNRAGGGLSGVFTGSEAISATDSARALVIGGGAGGGQSSSRAGGKGGGIEGQNGQGSNFGTAGGGGTQTSHGSGGNAGANQFNGGNGGGTYGYGGGGGRRGGRGSVGDSSGDDDKGAGGGSGYVISTASDIVLTQGGGAASGNNGVVTISSVYQG